jgi:hypothetical protein
MLRAGADIRKIEKALASATSKTVSDVQRIIKEEALEGYEQLQRSIGGYEQIPFKDNQHMQDLIEATAKQTGEQMENLSQTTGFALKNPDGTMRYTPLSNAYQDAIDDAIAAVNMGTTDYKTAMRDTLKNLADSGIRTIDYPSGYSRRLDSAVEQNIIDGVKQISQKVQDLVGERFGADGIELSVHNTCAPDHLPVQGRQFSKAEFAKMQSGEDCTDYKGRRYAGFRRPIGQWNCRHITFAIILGVSVPNYTDEQLEKIKGDNLKKDITIDDEQYTGYEAMRLQRKLENAIKHTRDRLNIATAAGDEQMVNQERLRLTQLTHKYKEVSDKAGLPYRAERLRSVQLTGGGGGGRMNGVSNSVLVGTKTKTDAIVKGVKGHFVDRLIERGIDANDIIDALKEPLHITEVKLNDKQEPSIQFIGDKVTVAYNPDTDIAVTGWKTGEARRRKYGGKR